MSATNLTTRATLTAITVALIASLTACGPSGGAPEFSQLDDQVAGVGSELVVIINATDPEGDELVYSFSSDVPDILNSARISRLPVGAGEFRWTPKAGDVGTWFFDFSASDGKHKETITIQIEVRSAIGANSAPRFLRPAGMGTTLNLSNDDCVELDIQVDDSDTNQVVIAEGKPKIEFSTLQTEGPQSAIWRWCPKPEQVAADNRYILKLTADDDDNPTIAHPYLIVLRDAVKQNCPGSAPVITHTPSNESSLTGLTIDATIADTEGLRAEPLLYYSFTQPSNPPNLADMTQLTMLLIDGDMRNGTWAADVPNPVAEDPQGTQKPVYYMIVANDDDDAEGNCDHVTESTVFEITVTNPGGAGGAGVCEACTTDVQCGDADDLCVRVGNGSGSFCLKSCASDTECPTDYTCSPDPVESINGASGRQCVPISADCSNPSGDTCDDDDREDNDSHFDAIFTPVMTPGTENLVSCPAEAGFGDDEDWIDIEFENEGMVTITLAGGDVTDLDLGLYDAQGAEIDRSGGLTSNESISACLVGGIYTMRVFAWGNGENPYALTYAYTEGDCGASSTCEADENEPDSDMNNARFVSVPYTSTTQSICPADDDWFDVFLVDGDLVVVDLTFEHSSTGDLDVHLFDAQGNDLTPCSPDDVGSCDVTNGQSGTDNEHFEQDITATGVYYVVVRGFDTDDTNLYDVSIQVQ